MAAAAGVRAERQTTSGRASQDLPDHDHRDDHTWQRGWQDFSQPIAVQLWVVVRNTSADHPLLRPMISTELDYTFHAMGSDVRLLIGPPLLSSARPQLDAADRERAFVFDFARRLSRFAPDSELTALNCDPRSEVPASALLRTAVSAGRWAAERSGGLVDPTLVHALEDNGYASSLDGAEPASLIDALAVAPARAPARPNSAAPWRRIAVDEGAGVIVRPAEVPFDSGGTGKGLCADAVAHRLGGYTRFVVDCGGDIAVGVSALSSSRTRSRSSIR